MSPRELHRVVLDGPGGVRELLAALPAALNGSGPALAPTAGDAPARTPPLPEHLDGLEDDPDDPSAVCVTTSGSTAPPRAVLLQASALLASAAAAHDRLGGPGRWLLALPAHHVAGVNVLIRSLVADRRPALMDPAASYTPDSFVRACTELEELGGPRRYTALVPTQLVRLLEAGSSALAALRGLDAVLVGGAATPPGLLRDARQAGVALVTSYGMSETCGGCVYDGVPLDGVEVGLDPATGRIRLAGAMVARGYLGPPGAQAGTGEAWPSPIGHFTTDEDARRWFVTDDAGHWSDPTQDGGRRLVVDGRLDGAVTTGGVTVSPAAVEAALTDLPGVAEAVVIGLPDDEWGQRLVAVLVAAQGTAGPGLADLRAHVAARLQPAAAPRDVRVVDRLPTLGPGKPDREALASLFADSPTATSAEPPGLA